MNIFRLLKTRNYLLHSLSGKGLIGAKVNQTCHCITIGSYVNNVCTVPLGLESL